MRLDCATFHFGHWALVLSEVEVLGTCTELVLSVAKGRSRSIGHWELEFESSASMAQS
ncbi:MAG: hypothetical protein V7L12_26235 [Nostoc sp.]